MTTCKQNKQHLLLKTPINQQNNKKKYQLWHFVCWTGILHQSGEHLQMSSLKFKFTLPTCITDYIFKKPGIYFIYLQILEFKIRERSKVSSCFPCTFLLTRGPRVTLLTRVEGFTN